MPSAKNRRNRGPVSRAVLDWFNRHARITYPEWKVQQPPPKERPMRESTRHAD